MCRGKDGFDDAGHGIGKGGNFIGEKTEKGELEKRKKERDHLEEKQGQRSSEEDIAQANKIRMNLMEENLVAQKVTALVPERERTCQGGTKKKGKREDRQRHVYVGNYRNEKNVWAPKGVGGKVGTQSQ